MSEAREVASEPVEHEDAETEQDEGQEVDAPDSEDEGEDEEAEPKPAAKPVDWEKRAHSHAGQAARERSRRQAAERRAQELETRLEKLERSSGADGDDELLTLIGSLRDDDEDPVGDILAVKRALKLFRQRELGSVEETRAQQRANREIETLKAGMLDAETDFALEYPDYKDAAAFYRKDRAEELEELGYRGDELMAKLSSDLFGLVKTAFNAGVDPAEKVYRLAVKRGFKAGQKQADSKLDKIDKAASSGVRPQARPAAGVLSWSDVAKLDGAARDKAWAALAKREQARDRAGR